MAAIKKTTTKTKSPAPATKPAAPKVAAKKKTASAAPVAPAASVAPVARATTQAPVSVATPPAPVESTPTIKVIAKKAAATRITARIDIGFGNALHVRGEGAGLSWDKGVVMNCLGSDEWEITLAESARPVVFKFLVNDLSWSVGADYTVASGEKITISPEF